MKHSIELRQAVGRILVALRATRNLTQEKLAFGSGVPLRTIQRAERGDGISAENLDGVALALETTAEKVLQEAASHRGPPPELRLQFQLVRSGGELLAQLKRASGNMHVGPEGEHAFNEDIGGSILELTDAVGKDSAITGKQTLENADYVVGYCEEVGFRLFICHYNEELEEGKKVIRRPTTLVVAVPRADPRIRKTSKGLVLDFVMDRRKQILSGVLQRKPTIYDWMEEQLISRSDGEARVRHAMQRIHDEVRHGKKNGRRQESGR